VILFADRFDAVNGTALAAHTPDVGGPWVDDTPGWQIFSDTPTQTADNAESHSEVTSPTMRAAWRYGTNGMAAGNKIGFFVLDNLNNNAFGVEIFGDGHVVCYVTLASTPILQQAIPPAQSGVLLAGSEWLELHVAPDRCTITINGQRVYDIPRPFLKTFEFQRFRFYAVALAGGGQPKFWQLTVED
jgi:hypothetical protein